MGKIRQHVLEAKLAWLTTQQKGGRFLLLFYFCLVVILCNQEREPYPNRG